MHPDNPLAAGAACFELLKRFEGLQLRAYFCPAGRLTIGYGHVIRPTMDYRLFGLNATRLAALVAACQASGAINREARALLGITPDQAQMLLTQDVQATVLFLRSVTPVCLSQPQFDALVALIYNIGQGHYATSTLRKRLHAEDYAAAAAEFDKWVMGTINGRKQPLPGLIIRRAAERALFEQP